MTNPFPPSVPEIPVANIDRAADYYQSNLGFKLDWGDDEGGIAGISKGDCRMFLTNPTFRKAAPVMIWFNLNSKEEVDQLYQQWKESHAKIVSAPEDKPWKLHEFTATDLDGNLFRVFYDFSRDV
jgi:predicted lactoylglutathione lyase